MRSDRSIDGQSGSGAVFSGKFLVTVNVGHVAMFGDFPAGSGESYPSATLGVTLLHYHTAIGARRGA